MASEPTFTPLHRGGQGDPVVLLHGFSDTWRTWELVLEPLERDHDVLALALPGHPGGPELAEPHGVATMLDQLEAALDAQEIRRARIVGNSLGGYLALGLAARGRADSVLALAPAGGWAEAAAAEVPMRMLGDLVRQAPDILPHLGRLLSSSPGRRNATLLSVVNYEHIPAELIEHQIRGLAAFGQSEELIAAARRDRWPLEPEKITCPVQIAWGTEDRILTWPSAAARFQRELGDADWILLDGVGHCPQLDVPDRIVELIAGA